MWPYRTSQLEVLHRNVVQGAIHLLNKENYVIFDKFFEDFYKIHLTERR